MLLAGDVGGTKTRLALYKGGPGALEQIAIEQFKSADFANVEDIIAAFLAKQNARPAAACLGIPGPVIDGTVKVTNLPWQLSEREIEAKVSIPRVKLVNDLVATAASLPYLRPQDIHVLYPGKPERNRTMRAVIAPGTGLGQAFLFTSDGYEVPLPSEGGHANFAPINEDQIGLKHFVEKQCKEPCSVEMVLSGPGLVNIYDYLVSVAPARQSAAVSEQIAKGIPAAVIIEHGIGDSDALCGKAIDIWCSILGAHVSNMVVSVLATGGVFLGGGLPPRIMKKLEGPILREAYLNKGKMTHQVEATPLSLIKDDHAAVIGAANLAARVK